MTEGCGLWPVQTGLRMTPPLLKELLNIGEKRGFREEQQVQEVKESGMESEKIWQSKEQI